MLKKHKVLLTLNEREIIEKLLNEGHSSTHIAKELQRNASTIYREITRNGGVEKYNAKLAQKRAEEMKASKYIKLSLSKLRYRRMRRTTSISDDYRDTYDLIDHIRNIDGNNLPEERNSCYYSDVNKKEYFELSQRIENLEMQIEILHESIKELMKK